VGGQPVPIGAHAAETVTLSIGVAAAAPDQGTRDYKVVADRLVAEADAALYRAKSAGRSRVAVSRNIVK
jgi:GGDEF domain-containing protein